MSFLRKLGSYIDVFFKFEYFCCELFQLCSIRELILDGLFDGELVAAMVDVASAD